MKARFSPRALRRMRVVATWWRKNRKAVPTLFYDELDAAIERVKDQPDSGVVYQTIGGEIIRRTLLPKSAQYVYYAADTVNGVIVIYTIWGARRRRGPKL